MKDFSRWVGGAALVLSLGAVGNASAGTGVSRQPIVYGEDDRVEVYQTDHPVLAERARQSVAALLMPHALEYTDAGEVRLSDRGSESLSLCPGERFRGQPAPALCSAVLVDDDLLVTAGHCLGGTREEVERSCIELAVLFGLSYASEGRLSPMTAEDVYRCREVVAWDYGGGDRLAPDLAVIQLDRSVVPPLRPAPLAMEPPMLGQRVHAIGFPSGLPVKVDSGGEVMEVGERNSYFGANTDTFGGSSGGPIFNDAGEALGVLVRGGKDYTFERSCVRVVQADDGYEDIQVIQGAVAQICDGGWPSERLCGLRPSCGDGFCSFAESASSCPGDCTPLRCGDGRCELSEPLGCARDCTRAARAPAGWTCPLEYYEDALGCDCDCGGRDIDCEDPAQEVLNCPEGWACGAAGYCLSPDGEQATRHGGRWVPIEPAPEAEDDEFLVLVDDDGCGVGTPSPLRGQWPSLLLGLGLLCVAKRRGARRSREEA